MTAISRDPEIMHGAACFTGTRVLVRTLFSYLEAGHNVDSFLSDFPSVSAEQVKAVLSEAVSGILGTGDVWDQTEHSQKMVTAETSVA